MMCEFEHNPQNAVLGYLILVLHGHMLLARIHSKPTLTSCVAAVAFGSLGCTVSPRCFKMMAAATSPVPRQCASDDEADNLQAAVQSPAEMTP
eukprot:2301896-Amphidinium_carterae.2